jgi:hypothetical protein
MTEIQLWDVLEERGLTPFEAQIMTKELLVKLNTTQLGVRVEIEHDEFTLSAVERNHGGIFFNLKTIRTTPLSQAVPKYLVMARIYFLRGTNCKSPEEVVVFKKKSIGEWCDCLNQTREEFNKTDKTMPAKTGSAHAA